MNRNFKIIVVLLCLCVAVPHVLAQGKCGMQTLAGTYVFYEKGSSSDFDQVPLSWPPFHYAGVIAPFVNISEVTFTANGVGDGFYWIKAGAMNGGLDPIPVHITITELNENCTGKMQYSVSLPGIPSATIEERIIVLNNGEEVRSVPRTIENGLPTLAWIGYGRRIRRASEPVKSCGRQTASGTYVLTCENLLVSPANNFRNVADATLFYLASKSDGSYTGMLYEKVGSYLPVETPVLGTTTVNPDCSFSQTLLIPEYFPDGPPVDIRGVFYNEGKDSYAMPITDGILGLCQGKRVGDTSNANPHRRGE